MAAEYNPSPLRTDGVVLPDSLNELLEKLAENAHEVWAAQRMKDGWTYGPKRDDGAKTHPCLVAYGELPESEKVYDRATAAETLKAILTLGFKIRGPK